MVKRNGIPVLIEPSIRNMIKGILAEKGKKRIKLEKFNEINTLDPYYEKIATQDEIHKAINGNTSSLHDRILTCMVPVSIIGRSPMNQVMKKGKPKQNSFTSLEETDAIKHQLEERLAAEVNALFSNDSRSGMFWETH